MQAPRKKRATNSRSRSGKPMKSATSTQRQSASGLRSNLGGSVDKSATSIVSIRQPFTPSLNGRGQNGSAMVLSQTLDPAGSKSGGTFELAAAQKQL